MSEVVDRELNISLPDGMRAYGWLREVENAPVVVMAHGNTAGIFEHPYDHGARVMSAAGFSVYRFGFYAGPSDARTTTAVSIHDHINDIDSVVRYFKERHSRVSVVGHSIGGLAALSSTERAFDALITWDASHPDIIRLSNWPDLWVWEPRLDCWRYRNGVESLISAEFVDTATSLDVRAAVASLAMPVKFIAASDGVNVEPAREFHALASVPKALCIIEGADHGFTADKHSRILYAETIDWLDKYGRLERKN